MELSLIFQISIYGMMCLSGVMLAIAEGTALPQGLIVPLVVLAFFFNERWQRLQLPSLWANLCGMLAFFLAMLEFFDNTIEGRLLSGAHLLVYLSWIVLFQKKTIKQYWWMLALGVLQVAVGSVLTRSGVYGVLLVGYLFWAIWTLSVFSLYQAQQQFSQAEQFALTAAWPANPSAQIAGQTAERIVRPTGVLRTSQVHGSIQRDPGERWIGPRFAAGAFGTAAGALLIAAVFYLLIPRIWIGKRPFSPDLPADAGRTLTGFAEEVRLGDFGEILESTKRVLEVRLFDDRTSEEIGVEEYTARLGYDEPLFRGSVLGQYESGRWSQGRLPGIPPRPLSSRNLPRNVVRQEIRLAPIGSRVLFAIHPVVGCRLENENDVPLLRLANSTLVRREPRLARDHVSYSVFSPRTADLGAVYSTLSWGDSIVIENLNEDLPPAGLERLIARSRQEAEFDSPNGRPSAAVMADRLVAYLRDSGTYTYSLDTSLQDPHIDPVEDFLFNRKKGHCEYFASALTLMLRAVEIPARLVSGFKGGKVNRFSGSFEVEQRHAHAWVEALIDGRWVVLDATPAAQRSQSVASLEKKMRPWHDMVEFTSQFWAKYVVQMDSFGKQQQEIYSPLRDWGREWFAALRGGPGGRTSFFTAIKRFLSSPRRWFSWQGGVATFVLLLLVALSVRLVPHLRSLWNRIATQFGKRGARKRTEVEFYDRFQKICAARGLVRGIAQTQREFADSVSGALNEVLRPSDLAALPAELVTSFYQVRFGAERLQAEQSAEIHRQLTLLESCLSGGNGRKQ